MNSFKKHSQFKSKKKSIFFIASAIMLVCISYKPCNAQSNASQFGVKGGVNFSQLFTKDAEKDNMKIGFNVGIYNKMPITEMFSFQPELYYSIKGAEVKYNNAFVDGTARFNLNYIEMPLLLVINITDNFNIHAGPYAAYLVSGDVKNESSGSIFDFEENINADDYNRFDVGFEGGVGIDFQLVSFGARYSYGLNKVGKEKTFLGTKYTFPDAKNGVLNLYIAVPLLSK